MKCILRAGKPNDENRDYVPDAIKGTDMVVNENGNNSQVYPERLRECTGILADGLEDRWYEYVPASYDGSKAVPLVISNHGGLMTGWAQAVYTSWTLLAEREGFICVFPDAHALKMWTIQGMSAFHKNSENHLPINIDPPDYRENHDLNFVKALIEEMKKKYRIDAGRIFMQGMSMGHMMTDQFARYYGDLLTGAAGSGAAAVESQICDRDGKLLNYGGPLEIWISHPEQNGMGRDDAREHASQRATRKYWMAVNECDPLPRISIIGEDNFAFYSGKKADLVYLDIKNRDHGQTLDEAYLYWDYMFGCVRREKDGTLVRTKPKADTSGDTFGLALADGCSNAWFGNQPTPLSTPPVLWQKLKYHGLDGGQIVRGEYLCVPVSFLAKIFDAEYIPGQDSLTATVKLPDGRTLQFARGVIGCMINDTLRSMYCEALHRNGELLVSVEWFCRYLFGLHVSSCKGMVYITDHHAELSEYMAALIRDLLTEA